MATLPTLRSLIHKAKLAQKRNWKKNIIFQVLVFRGDLIEYEEENLPARVEQATHQHTSVCMFQLYALWTETFFIFVIFI